MTSAAPDWLADPALAPLWRRVRTRLERTGLRPTGRLRLTGLRRAERHALSGLLGRPVLTASCTVDLPALDATLWERSGIGGLSDVVVAVSGEPLRDLVRERAERSALRDEPLDLARELVVGPWVDGWLAGLRSAGVLTGRPDGSATVEAAARVLSRILPGGEQTTSGTTLSRVDLAAATTGDAHALDDDRLLSTVVLRAVGAALGERPPASPAERRGLWERVGVLTDSVSSTCLTVGVRLPAGSNLADRLNLAADVGAPVHLTGWDLGGWQAEPSDLRGGDPVLVCENPRVLEAVAERRGGDVTVVCTAGEPNTVVLRVLERLARSGARLLSHGDFDWPGLAIVNRLVERLGVEPWLMDAAAYSAAVQRSGRELAGDPVPAAWDPALAPAMERVGFAVHEEAVLPALLDALEDLAPRAAGRGGPDRL